MRQEELEDMYNLEKEHWWFKSKRKIIKYFIKKYGKPGSLLDIGCGTGITLLELKDSFEVFGVDSSKIALEFCKKRGLKNLKLSPAEKLPFKDESFDNILALDMLEHTDDELVLKEIYRVLKKDGTLIVTVPALQMLWTKHDEIFQHKRRYNKKELKEKLIKYNFKIQKLSYWNFILFPLAIIYKFINKKSHIQPAPKYLNKLLTAGLSIDNFFIKFINLPYGVSLIGIFKK